MSKSNDYPSGPVIELDTALGPIVAHVNNDDRIRIESGIPLNVGIGEPGGPRGCLTVNGKPAAVQGDAYRDDAGQWQLGTRYYAESYPNAARQNVKTTRRDTWTDGTDSMNRRASDAIIAAVREWTATPEGARLLAEGERAERARDLYTARRKLAEHQEHVDAFARKVELIESGAPRSEYGGPYIDGID